MSTFSSLKNQKIKSPGFHVKFNGTAGNVKTKCTITVADSQPLFLSLFLPPSSYRFMLFIRGASVMENHPTASGPH